MSGYFAALDTLIVVLAWAVLISGLDDLFIDVYFWSQQLVARLRGRPGLGRVTAHELRAVPEQYLAIMVPAWREQDVIASMAQNTLRTLDYQNYVVFIGTYRNDPATTDEAETLCAHDPARIVRAAVDRDGPTCKADCLNWILKAIADYERSHHIEFAGFIMHDCEDVVHPLELRYFNQQLAHADMIQLPVMSLELPWSSWVGGAYLDDFSEVHQKDLHVREALTGVVPGAGVALCYSRRAMTAMSDTYQGQPFNTGSLTEDYDFSFRLAAAGFRRQMFARHLVERPARGALDLWKRPATATGLLATCEYFPSEFRAAYRQRARWTLGIVFLGWRHLGWRGGLWDKYMLLRDRKGVVTAPLSMLAYFALGNLVLLPPLLGDSPAAADLAQSVMRQPWLPNLLACNLVLLANRTVQRAYFVSRSSGLLCGMLAIPRMIVNNFINFAAVSRAWQQWLRHLITGVPIAWDKTPHTFPTTEALAHHRRRLGDILIERGIITVDDLDAALVKQRASGQRLGQVLVEQGRVSPEALADAVADQYQLPRAQPDLRPYSDPGLRLPSQVIRAYHVVPLALTADNTLQVAVASRPTSEGTKAIRASSGYQVAYVVACDHELDAWMDFLAPDTADRETES